MTDTTDIEPTEDAVTDPIEQLRASNQAKVDDLQRQGVGIDPNLFVGLGFQTLVDLLLPPGSTFRHVYEVQLGINIGQFLDAEGAQALQRKLTEGVEGFLQ